MAKAGKECLGSLTRQVGQRLTEEIIRQLTSETSVRHWTDRISGTGIGGSEPNESRSCRPRKDDRQGRSSCDPQRRGTRRIYRLFHLTSLPRPNRSEEEAIELLTLLIERYEVEHYPIPSSDPVSVVRFLLEHQNLSQRDLIPEFGSESAVSMFLSGQRNLTLEQVRRLSSRFRLSSDVFINSGNA
jgi:HTH-type transcriptional regulator / antitoxin HigA